MKTTLKTLPNARFLAFVFLLIAGLLNLANNVANAQSKRVNNIVLVHGAFADGSGWKPVYDLLVKKGYHVSIVQNPLTSLKADVDAANSVITSKTERSY
jgi:hypothetical protein